MAMYDTVWLVSGVCPSIATTVEVKDSANHD
jgi:hypothetical protein